MDLAEIPALLDVANALNTSLDIALLVSVGVLLAALIVTLLVVRLSLGGPKRDSIVILGLSGAGKTSLFYQLRDGSIHGGTVTSMAANEGRFALHSEAMKKQKVRPVRLVDVPGHPRLRAGVSQALQQSCGVVFLVDALDFMPQCRAISEFLYEILSMREVVRARVPLLVACNKCDKMSAHSIDFIRRQLEKEIDKLRSTRSAISDADVSTEIKIGRDNEPFHFSHCVNKVSFAEASVLTRNLGAVETFIREQVKS